MGRNDDGCEKANSLKELKMVYCIGIDFKNKYIVFETETVNYYMKFKDDEIARKLRYNFIPFFPGEIR